MYDNEEDDEDAEVRAWELEQMMKGGGKKLSAAIQVSVWCSFFIICFFVFVFFFLFVFLLCFCVWFFFLFFSLLFWFCLMMKGGGKMLSAAIQGCDFLFVFFLF